MGKGRPLTEFEKNLREEIFKRDNHIENSVKYAIDRGDDYGVLKNTPQWRRDAIEKYKNEHKTSVFDDDGNEVGKISYEARRAIRKNKISDYKPQNDDEKKVFDYLKNRRAESEKSASELKKKVSNELFSLKNNKNRLGGIKPDVVNLHDRAAVKNEYSRTEGEAKKYKPDDNEIFEVSVSPSRTVKLKYGIKNKIDDIAGENGIASDLKAKRIDEAIEKLNLSEGELSDARSYAGIKKLELASASNGKNNFIKEISQPIVKFLMGTRDAAEGAAKFLKNGGKLNGDYSEEYANIEKYYEEHPDELGNDLFDTYISGMSNPKGDYLRNTAVDKMLEAYNDTTKASQFIGDAGFRSAGQMMGASALAYGSGAAEAASGATALIKNAADGTKAAKVISKAASIAPKISEVGGSGNVSRAANTAIKKVNSLSVGKALKFLNPFDNPTTVIMGMNAAQDKYDALKKMGYDDDTSKKNALFSGYVSAITEKMGYDGKPESFFFNRNGKPIAGSATASKSKNAKKLIKDYLTANVSEGVEEIYNTVFERMGDYLSKVGYVDENGHLKQRKVFGNEGIFDVKDMGENFLGGFVGGAVMGSVGVLSNIASYDTKTVHEYADEVKKQVSKSNELVEKYAKESGMEAVSLPDEPDWKKASVNEINNYYEKAVDAHLNILFNENVIKNDSEKLDGAEKLIATPDDSTSAYADDGQIHDASENLAEGNAGVSVQQLESGVKKLTDNLTAEYKSSYIKNIPNYQTVYDENLRLSSTPGKVVDEQFVRTYALSYAEGLRQNNSKAYKKLSAVSDDVGGMLSDYILRNKTPQGIETNEDMSALYRTAGGLKRIINRAANAVMSANNQIYGKSDTLTEAANEISRGNYSVIKYENAGDISLSKVGEYYEAYGTDAVKLKNLLSVSTHYTERNGSKTLVAAIPAGDINEYINTLKLSANAYSAGGREFISLTPNTADTTNGSGTDERKTDAYESNSNIEVSENEISVSSEPSAQQVSEIALVISRNPSIPLILNGNEKSGETVLFYAEEEDTSRERIENDINSYYDGVIPEIGTKIPNEYDEDMKFSVESVDGTDKKYVKADRQVISGENPEEWRKQVYNYINTSIRKGKNINVLSADGDVLTITEDTAGKARFRNTIREPSGNMRKMTNDEFAVKLRAESHIDEIAEVSKKNGYSAVDTKNHNFAKDGFYYRTAYFEDFDGKYYKLTLSVGKSGEINTVYNVGKLKETYGRARDSKVVEQKPNNARRDFSNEVDPFKTAVETNNGLRGGATSDNTNISQSDEAVNSSIRENAENDTDIKFSQDKSLDGGGGISYNDDINIPYRESVQLREYIIAENNRDGSELKPFDKKEIGDNFYVWKNNSKTDYDVVMQIEIDGNEDIIDLIRKELDNGKTHRIDDGTKRLDEIVAGVRDRRRGDNSDNARNTAELSNGNDDRLYPRQSSDDDGIKLARESNRNQQNTEVDNYGRDDILNGDDRRTPGKSEGERGSSFREIAGNAERNAGEEQSGASSRRIYARDVKEAGGVERRTDRGVEADFVKPEYYNDEMRRIAAENDERGVITHFILGNGRALRHGTNFRGAVRGNEVYIQADHGKYSPSQINRHEIIHRNYSTDTVLELKNRILSRLTNKQVNDISERLYRDYAQKRRSFDEIFEEFVCDVLADMNDYAEMFSTETREYWTAEEQERKGYSPSTYRESIDAGGKNVAENKIEPLAWNSDKKSVHPINAFGSNNNNISQNDSVVNNSSANAEFSNQVDSWKDGSMDKNEVFNLGNTPDVLKNIGADGLPIIMTQKVMNKITGGKHDIDLSEIKRLPQSIAEPIMLFKSATTPNAYVILTELSDKNGNSVVAALHLNRMQRHIAVNRIASVYGKENIENFVDRQAKAGNMIFADKNKSQQWSQSRGLQLPKLADTIADNTNISQNDNIVNSNIRENSRNDTDIRFSADENTDVNVSGDEDMSYLSEPVKNIKNDIREVRLRAEASHGKVFDRKDINEVCDSILNNINTGAVRGIEIKSKKDRTVMSVLVNRVLNSAGVDAKRKHTRALARFIAQNATAYDSKSLSAADGVDYESDKAVITSYIKHGVKLSPDAKEAVISVVGESSAKGYISMMSNENALGIDAVYDELRLVMPEYFTEDLLSDGDKMRRVMEVYTWLKEGRDLQEQKLIDIMDESDRREFTDILSQQLDDAFEMRGRESLLDLELVKERQRNEKKIKALEDKYRDKISELRSKAENKIKNSAEKKKIEVKQERYKFKSLSEAVSKYGRIKEGEKPYRETAVPRKIDKDRYVSRFARTMVEAGVTPNEALSEFEERILSGDMTYERITDEKAKNYAEEKIKRRGFLKSLEDWDEMILSNQRIGKNEMAFGQMLYNQCINAKDAKHAMKIAADLANIATQAGQMVQACQLLKQMSPDCQLYSLEQSVSKMEDEFRQQLKLLSGKNRDIDIKINESFAQEYLNAETQEERDIAMDKLLEDIAGQIPSSLKDKWDSWRYLSMLGNPRTHIRNIGGNLVFMLPVHLKNTLSYIAEKAIPKGQRTKSYIKTAESKEFAKRDYIKMKDIIQGNSGKFEGISKINELRRIYKFKLLEWLRKMNFALLEWEDGIFLKHHYENALAQIMTARGYTAEFLNSGTSEARAALEAARAYAINEAQKATYRDANAAAEAISSAQRKLQNSKYFAGRAAGLALEGVVPFKKTPLNIVKRGIEYSPVGLINGVYDMAFNIKSGKTTAAEAIDKLASGLVGTALTVLGMWLASIGLVRGDGDDDKNAERLDNATGEQSYSVRIGKHSYTIDWVAPASMPFFVGVNIQKAFASDKKFTFEDIVKALVKIPDPIMSLSVLSSLSDLLSAGNYADTGAEKAAAYAWQTATSYVGQAYPTMFGQIARTIDKAKRNTYYADTENGIPDGLERFINRQLAKTPGASRLIEPKIDMWGREETYGDTWYGRFVGNTLSPGYYKEIDSTALDDELRRLNEEYEGDGSVLPPKIPKYFTYEKQKYYMNPSEYTKYSVIRGQKSFEAADELIRTDGYKNKSAEEKKKALEKCYDAAGDEARNEILKGRGVDVAEKEAEKEQSKKKSKSKSSNKRFR